MNLLTQSATITRATDAGTKDKYGQPETTSAVVYDSYPCRVYFQNFGAVPKGKEYERGANIFKAPNMLAMNTGVALVRDDVAVVGLHTYRVIGGDEVRNLSANHHTEWEIEEII